MGKYDEILDAVHSLFAAFGYGFTMDQLAERVGLKKATLYNYCSGKDELLKAAVERELSSFFTMRQLEIQEIERVPIENRLQQVYFTGLAHFKDQERLRFWKYMMLVTNEPLYGMIRQSFRDNEAPYVNYLQDIIRRLSLSGIIRPEAERTALLQFVALSQGVLEALLYRRGEEMDWYFSLVWQGYWEGIRINNWDTTTGKVK